MSPNVSPAKTTSTGPVVLDDGIPQLTPADAEKILKLLCNGVQAEHKIHLDCYLVTPPSKPRRLNGIETDAYYNSFCRCAWHGRTTSKICTTWYAEAAKACQDAGPTAPFHVLQCPFGLEVFAAHVEYRGVVRIVLFTGNWRQSGSEGLIYYRLNRADISGDERDALTEHIDTIDALVSEELQERKNRFRTCGRGRSEADLLDSLTGSFGARASA